MQHTLSKRQRNTARCAYPEMQSFRGKWTVLCVRGAKFSQGPTVENFDACSVQYVFYSRVVSEGD